MNEAQLNNLRVLYMGPKQAEEKPIRKPTTPAEATTSGTSIGRILAEPSPEN